MKTFTFILAAVVITVWMPPLAADERRKTTRHVRWVFSPRGVTQYLTGQRHQVHDTVRRILHAPERVVRNSESEGIDPEPRLTSVPQQRSRYGDQRVAAEPRVWIERDAVGRETIVTAHTTANPAGRLLTPVTRTNYQAPVRELPTAHVPPTVPPAPIRTENHTFGTENVAPPTLETDKLPPPNPALASNSQPKKRSASRASSRTRAEKTKPRTEMWGSGDSSHTAGETAAGEDSALPFGVPVPEKDGLVYSPFSNDGYVDIKGMPSGSKARCPYSKKVFRVP